MALQQIGAALLENGTAWTWGMNVHGQLGDNTTTDKSSPVSVVGAHSFTHITGGPSYTAALKGATGEVWTWGRNTRSELGDNTGTTRSSPVSVVGSFSFTQISSGGFHNTGLIEDTGEVWTWGYNNAGQLGDNSITERSSPVSVVGEHSFVEITASRLHCYGRKEDGSVWAWGNNYWGYLGDDTSGSSAHKSSPVSVVGAHSFTKIRSGDSALALKETGELWAWGSNGYGKLGDNTTNSRSSPVSVVGEHSFTEMAGGWFHSLALKDDGSVWTWGLNDSGELGDNTVDSKSSPVSVVGAHSFIQIAAGCYISFGLKRNGEIWGWGLNTSGQLGDNTNDNRSSPVLVVGAFEFYRIMACLSIKYRFSKIMDCLREEEAAAYIPRVFIM